MRSLILALSALFVIGCGSSSGERDAGTIVAVPGTNNYPQTGELDGGASIDVQVTFDGGSCPSVVPCGGDLVGTWNYVAVCEDGTWATLLKSVQPCAAEVRAGMTGSVTYRLDGTYRQKVSLKLTIGWDNGCLQRTGSGCGNGCLLGADNVCRCDQAWPDLEESGTYSATGTTAIMVAAGLDAAAPSVFGYCVQDKTLYSIGNFLVKSSGGALPNVNESGYVTATKAD